jgi:hypothetical protein
MQKLPFATTDSPFPCHTTCLLQPQQQPARLGFRFFQLVMAVALKQALLPNLSSQPTAYDPDYDQFDRALLGQLGFRALQEQPSYDVAGSGAALLYMPCCPRELYAAVLVSVRVVQCSVTGLIYAYMLLLPELDCLC